MAKKQLETMIQAATVDCYNESEQVTGWFTVIDENLAVPFETTVLGVAVTVERVDLAPPSPACADLLKLRAA